MIVKSLRLAVCVDWWVLPCMIRNRESSSTVVLVDDLTIGYIEDFRELNSIGFTVWSLCGLSNSAQWPLKWLENCNLFQSYFIEWSKEEHQKEIIGSNYCLMSTKTSCWLFQGCYYRTWPNRSTSDVILRGGAKSLSWPPNLLPRGYYASSHASSSS